MLCTEALGSCSQEGRLWAGLHTIKQIIKIICNSFNAGQMPSYNGFLKMQKRSSVNTED